MAEISVIKDRSGVPMYYGDADGVWLPTFPLPYPYPHQLDVIRDTPIRDDDVIITGYGKCGVNWHYEMIHMLHRGVAQYIRNDKQAEMIDKLTREEIDNLPSPRVLNTHVPFKYLPKQALEKRTKMVYLLRNPKDVAVSFHHMLYDWTANGYAGSWEDFLQLFLYTGVWCNRWFDYVRDWERELDNHPEQQVFVSVYEHCIKDPVGQVMKLNDFLGLGRSRELCEQIADACSFSKLKAAAEDSKVKVNSIKDCFKAGSPGMFRKGKVGDWVDHFTDEQNKEFDEVYQREMQGSKLDIIFTL